MFINQVITAEISKELIQLQNTGVTVTLIVINDLVDRDQINMYVDQETTKVIYIDGNKLTDENVKDGTNPLYEGRYEVSTNFT